MSAAEILRTLLETTVAASIAIALALALRRPLRTLAGAGIAYAVWWIVPVAVLAALLPAARQTPMPAQVQAFVGQVTPRLLVDTASAPGDWTAWLLAAWIIGVLATIAVFIRHQRAFLQGLGRLTARGDGMHACESVPGLPAAVGIWRTRIVVPSDFDRRYHALERELMHAHERQHIVHGDPLINAGVAALRCVLWFNPVLHWAARAFRQDQELACDQRVIAGYPHARRIYGEAMLKTQLASQPLPLGCHWGFSHPLKERIAMLNQPLPSTRRLLAGTLCVTVLALACGYAAWASQPPVPSQTVPAGQLRMDLSLRIDEGAPLAASQLAAADTPVILRQSVDGHAWVVTAHAAPASGGTHQLDALITRDGRQVAAPRLVVQPGVPARIHVGDDASAVGGRFTGVQLDVTVTGPGTTASGAVTATDAMTTTSAALMGPTPSPNDGSQLQAPAYPADALARKIDGTVVLGIDIDATGKVTAVDVVRSEPAGVFDAAATKAAWNWRLPPAMKDGKPVAGRVEVPVRFEHKRAPGAAAKSPA